MPKQKLEIECPVCDAKLSIDARSCPKCGADLGMADFQDLERLANDISGGSATFEPAPAPESEEEKDADPEPAAEETAAPGIEATSSGPEKQTTVPAEPKAPASKEERSDDADQGDQGKKKGLFSKFFGKKK